MFAFVCEREIGGFSAATGIANYGEIITWRLHDWLALWKQLVLSDGKEAAGRLAAAAAACFVGWLASWLV